MIESCILRCSVLSLVVVGISTPTSAAVFNWNGGAFTPGVTAPSPLPAADVLNIDAGANKFFNGVAFVNQGTVNWNADSLSLQNAAAVTNAGLWTAFSDNGLVNSGGSLSSFTNTGTFRKSAGAGNTTIGSVAFVNSGIIDAQAGAIVFNGANATFNAGTQFTGAGAVLIANNAAFNGAFSSANLSLQAGTFTGAAAQINGTVDFTGGSFGGIWEVAGGQTLAGKAGGGKILNGAAVTNNGTIAWQADNNLSLQNGASLLNQGTLDLQGNMSLANTGGTLSTVTNSNLMKVGAGKTVTVGSVRFVNNGTGVLDVAGTLDVAGANATFHDGTRFIGAGEVLVTNNATFNGAIFSDNLSLRAGSYAGGNAALTGMVELTGGSFTGTWSLGGGQTLVANTGGGKVLNGAALTNNGTIVWQTNNNLSLQNGASLLNQGTLDLQGDMTLANTGGSLPTVTNSNLMQVASGNTVTVGSVRFVNNGTGVLDVAGTLNFSGANATFHDGTRFIGAGEVLVTNNATFNGAIFSDNLSLRAGSYAGGNAALTGMVELTGGSFTGAWALGSGQTLVANTGGGKTLNGADFTNAGTVTWQAANNLTLQNGADFDNQGLFDFQTGASLLNAGGSLPRFTNSGTLRVGAGQTATVGSLAFVNNGGLVEVGAGGVLLFSGANATFNAGTQLTGAGQVQVTNNVVFNGASSATNLSLQGGTYTGGNAVLGGSAELTAGTFVGTWTLAGGSTLAGLTGGGKILNGATLTNAGTIAWQTANNLSLQNGADLNNQGLFDLQADGSLVYTGGSIGTFVNTGLIAKTGGTGTSTIGNNLGFVNRGTVDVRSGTIGLPGSFVNQGTLMGTGTFATNTLTNSGHVAPGASPGTLTVNANFVQTAQGTFDVELQNLSSFDLLLISGNATLAGTLALHCFANCSFAVGDELVILDAAGQLTGSFTSMTMDGFVTGAFAVIYDTTLDRVLLRVTEDVSSVPEPQTYALTLAGLALLGWFARRRGGGRGKAPVA